jgi:hypothetical protein
MKPLSRAGALVALALVTSCAEPPPASAPEDDDEGVVDPAPVPGGTRPPTPARERDAAPPADPGSPAPATSTGRDAAPRPDAAAPDVSEGTNAGADTGAPAADAAAPLPLTNGPLPTGPLPIVIIDVAGQTLPRSPTGKKVSGTLKIVEDHDGMFDWRNPRPLTTRPVAFETPIGISRHGNASDLYGEQKPFNIELRDAAGKERHAPLLGMPKEADWVLNACWVDRTCMKHALVYDAFRDMGRWAARFRWVEVLLDGKYNGMYLLMEKIRRDKNRVNIPAVAPDATGDLTGGYIWKMDSPVDGPGREWLSKAGLRWSWYRPRWDTITPAQKKYLQDHLNAFDDVWQGPSFGDPKTGYRAWLDVPSFVDYMLMNELSMNTDGLWRSAFFHKQTEANGNKIIAGPGWDYDLAFGVEFRAVHRTDAWQHQLLAAALPREDCCKAYAKVFDFWKKLWADPAFQRDLKCRWTELRRGPLSTATLHGKIDAWTKHIAAAEKRHHERYKVIGIKYFGLHFVGKTWAEDVAYLKRWIGERVKWMDANLPGTCR